VYTLYPNVDRKLKKGSYRSRYASEDMALPEAIMRHIKKYDGHRNIYVMDRGLQSTRVMKAFNDPRVTFIARAKQKRKFVELRPLEVLVE